MPNLLFCMTPGIGLNTWNRIGSLTREVKPYVEYVKRGWQVKILTFDKEKPPQLTEDIDTIHFPSPYYLWFLHRTHAYLGKWADVVKTNQSNWAYFYTRAANYWKKPILLRCGYVKGEYLETTVGLTPKVRLYQWFERTAFRQATHCQLPTDELSDWVQKKYRISRVKISIVPNFVDTDIFKPIAGVQKKEKSVISIGRLDPVKQFDLLIKACAAIEGCNLTIVGEGPERKKLTGLADNLHVNLSLPGNVSNDEIPNILQQHKIFAITSKREGHPKALIEAMACGMPCIGVKSPGIMHIIQHNINGFIVEKEIESLRIAIIQLMQDSTTRSHIANEARAFVIKSYSFSTCFESEHQTISSLLER